MSMARDAPRSEPAYPHPSPPTLHLAYLPACRSTPYLPLAPTLQRYNSTPTPPACNPTTLPTPPACNPTTLPTPPACNPTTRLKPSSVPLPPPLPPCPAHPSPVRKHAQPLLQGWLRPLQRGQHQQRGNLQLHDTRYCRFRRCYSLWGCAPAAAGRGGGRGGAWPQPL